MTVSIYDSDKLSEDEYLGTVELELETVRESQFQDVWFDLLENSGKIKLRTCWYDVSREDEGRAPRIISGFVGSMKTDVGRLPEDLGIQITVETEDNSFSSKVVRSENGRIVFNEGFMLMIKIKEKKCCVKIIDSENGAKLGQRYLNHREIRKMPKYLEIETEKVWIFKTVIVIVNDFI